MGVDRHQLAGQNGNSQLPGPARESTAKRAKALPAVGIYRPPALRRTEEQNSPAVRPVSPQSTTKPERPRSARQRRPDIQVYVPRAKRLSLNEKDQKLVSAQQCSSSSTRTKERLQDTSLTNKDSRHITSHQTNKAISLPSSSLNGWNDQSDRSASNEIYKPFAQSDCFPRMSDFDKLIPNRKFISSDNLLSVEEVRENVFHRKEDTKFQYLDKEDVVKEDNCVTTSLECLPRKFGSKSSGDNEAVKQFVDRDNLKNDAERSTVCMEARDYNFPAIHTEEEKFEADGDVEMLAAWKYSRPDEYAGNFEETTAKQDIIPRSSRSSSFTSTPGNSGRNSPFTSGDSGGQYWDYFSEIKNATENSRVKPRLSDLDIQNISDSRIIEDCSVGSQMLEGTLSYEESKSSVNDCDNSSQFLDSSETCRGTSQNTSGDSDNRLISAQLDSEISNFADSEKHSAELHDVPSTEQHGYKKDEDEDSRVQELKNRKNRRIIRDSFMSDVLIISDPEPVTSTTLQGEVVSVEEKASVPNGVLTKKKKVRHKSESGSSIKSSPEKQKTATTNSTAVNLNPDECTWDMMFDDNGECLDPKLMEELTNSVGSVTIEKPQSDYRSYQSRVELIMSGAADDEFSHVLEIYNFPPEFKTHDLHAVFSPYMKGGFEIKWVDDTHALGIFSSPSVAAEVLATSHPFVKTRPLQEATHDSRMKARRSAEFLQPYRPRPETCAALARRLVTGALGVKLNTTKEEREAERKLLKEAREKRRLAARQREEAWEGTLGEK